MPNSRIYWLHALSPTHAGVGRGVGYIDLPIDRDGVTGWPIIRGSAFKGVWADHHGRELIPTPDEEEVDGKSRSKDRRKMDTPEGRLLKAAFGIAGDNNDSNSGALIPTDAKIVALPVRSFRGTFAWTTSPLVLKTLKRTLELAGSEAPIVPDMTVENQSFVTGDTLVHDDKNVYLEDLDFIAKEDEDTRQWAKWIAKSVFGQSDPWAAEFEKRFVVLPDNAFDFLCETGTEVHTRVRIDDDTKTVANGALWTEESLPAETILMGLIQCDRVFGRDGKEIKADGLLTKFTGKPLTLQIGGKATVGRGQVRCVFTEVK